MQQLSVLKNGFSPHEKEALEEMNYRVSKTLTFNGKKYYKCEILLLCIVELHVNAFKCKSSLLYKSILICFENSMNGMR